MSESRRTDPIQGEIVHEYDGILEADNRLPNWWLATFFGAIAFGALYWFAYESWHFAQSPREQYTAAMEAAAEAGGEVSDEMLGLIAENDQRVSDGRNTFASNCAACHGQRGEGQIGPNLTDANWIHGGAPTSLYTTVRNGVPSAGMPAWGPVLGERTVQSVVAYLMSIRDTNVPGREPQGDVWVPGAAPSEGEPAAPSEPAAPAEAPSAAAPSASAPRI
ncbi:c-type cytochrome [Sandaracinus amylolyticus]|uniref:c-type cytochrome n=1 Tax=Sandaracinus amylolyticus TaxID=927083 RepID=UPI001F007E1B|nr:c-type cytochrome [Sandaracinus amylolyticus]UJR79457.1 Cytochrome c oxidase subunit CcoP [Sandaracinus amylolyticus]